MEGIVIYLFVICISSLGSCPDLLPIFNWLVCFLIVGYLRVFCLVWMLVFYKIHVSKIFFSNL